LTLHKRTILKIRLDGILLRAWIPDNYYSCMCVCVCVCVCVCEVHHLTHLVIIMHSYLEKCQYWRVCCLLGPQINCRWLNKQCRCRFLWTVHHKTFEHEHNDSLVCYEFQFFLFLLAICDFIHLLELLTLDWKNTQVCKRVFYPYTPRRNICRNLWQEIIGPCACLKM